METPHLIFKPAHDTNWDLVDVMNTCFYEILDDSDNYYVYGHNNNLNTSCAGFYILKIYRSGAMRLYDCLCHPMEPLCVLATLQLNLLYPLVGTATHNSKLEARRAYDNFIQDHITFECYGISYNEFMTNVIDHLIMLQDIECDSPDTHDRRLDQTSMNFPNSQTIHHSSFSQTIDGTNYNVPKARTQVDHAKLARDINNPRKTKGYIALQSTEFSFIGPDKLPQDTSNVTQYLRIAKVIRESGLPNYKLARIPLISGLKIDAWKAHLHDYPDKKLLQYLQFGFPLSLKDPSVLHNQDVKNHYSALQFPLAIEQYLEKELSKGPIIGPLSDLDQNSQHGYVHFSPLLTHPKGPDKRRIILDLSFSKGFLMNDQVDRTLFDKSEFCPKFPSTDDIVDEICKHGDDVTIAKIDVARAFRNLRVDPADALKLGIKWKDDAFIDVSDDAVTYIMAKNDAKLLAYIDHYILISPKTTADTHFQRLASLLSELGLPSNPD